MRVAIIADIHANVPALEAVLDDIAHLDIDDVLVNGDLVNRGPGNVGVLRLLEPYLARTTLGNHDDLMRMWIERDPSLPREWYDDPFWSSTALCATELDAAGYIATLRELPMTLRVDAPGAPAVLVSHGSPRHYREGYGSFLSDEDISEITQMHPADVLVGSHTHRPLQRRWGHYRVLNTGSVGSPFNGDPRAQYLVLELGPHGWAPEFRRVPYDREAALRAFETSGFLDRGGLSARIFHQELRYARSFLVPFLMWCEEGGRAREEATWEEFRRRFARRFRDPPAPPPGVEATAEVEA